MAEFVLLKPHGHRRAMLLVTLYLCAVGLGGLDRFLFAGGWPAIDPKETTHYKSY